MASPSASHVSSVLSLSRKSSQAGRRSAFCPNAYSCRRNDPGIVARAQRHLPYLTVSSHSRKETERLTATL
jgi:hypothetical protein